MLRFFCVGLSVVLGATVGLLVVGAELGFPLGSKVSTTGSLEVG